MGLKIKSETIMEYCDTCKNLICPKCNIPESTTETEEKCPVCGGFLKGNIEKTKANIWGCAVYTDDKRGWESKCFNCNTWFPTSKKYSTTIENPSE